jgi:hypothetical protein
MSQDDFGKSVRKHITNARLQFLGTTLSATGSMSLLFGVDRYFPEVKEPRYVFVIVCVILGVSLQMWSASRSFKVGSAPGIREWTKSLPEVRRSLTLMTIAFGYAAVLLFILMGLSIDDSRHIDFLTVTSLGMVGLVWVMFFGELLVPRKLKTLDVA